MSKIKLNAPTGGGSVSLEAPSSTTSNADIELKLPVADGSAGQFIKTDGSGNLSFDAASGTTINNNADNRVITGSGTANTLNAESNLTLDSSGQLTSTASNNGQIIHKYKNTDATGSSSAMTVEQHFNFNRTGGGLDLSAARIIAGKEREWVGGASNQDGFLAFHTCGNETPAERIRIDSGGDVGIGTTIPNNADSADGGLQIQPNHSNGAPTVTWKRANNGSTSTAAGFTNGTTGVGSITYTNGGTSFNTSSDYRLKENVIPLSDGITRLKTLKPYRFNFIIDADKTVDGFLAHEVTPVVPEAITGKKDGMKPETYYQEGDTLPSGKVIGDVKTYSSTKPEYQGIDQAKLVPLLTAALQEAIAKIELLETKVAALEAA